MFNRRVTTHIFGRNEGGGRNEGVRNDGVRNDGVRNDGVRNDGVRNENGRNEGGRNENGRNENGRNEGGRNEGGRNEGGRNEGGRNEGGRNEGGRNEGGRNEGGRYNNGRNDYYRNNTFRSKPSEREMDRTLEYYRELCTRVPNYIRDKLKTMPNNKGYIWKNMYLYGECEVVDDKDYEVITMFEKINNDMTRIHIWDINTYKVYEKESGNGKILIKEEKRKSIQNEVKMIDKKIYT